MGVTISREAAEAIKVAIDNNTHVGLTNPLARIIDTFVEEKTPRESMWLHETIGWGEVIPAQKVQVMEIRGDIVIVKILSGKDIAVPCTSLSPMLPNGLTVGDWSWDTVHNRMVSLLVYKGKLGYHKTSLAGSTIFYSGDCCIPIVEKFPVGSFIKDRRFGIGTVVEYGGDGIQYKGEFGDGHIFYGYIEHISEVQDSDWERTVRNTVFRAYQRADEAPWLEWKGESGYKITDRSFLATLIIEEHKIPIKKV